MIDDAADTGLGRSDEVLDMLLDQEGLEVDPIDRMESDTPLHKAVRFINGLSKEEWESAASIAELLLDAGADPRYFGEPNHYQVHIYTYRG